MSVFPTSSVLNASFATVSTLEDDEDRLMPWEEEDFVPRTSAGKQKSPNVIRNELQRYIDASSETQTAIIERMGINNNSFRRFMNPKTYKDQWNACENGTYWAAARLLEQAKHEAKTAKKQASKKRKTVGDGAAADSNKRSKSDAKAEAKQLFDSVNQVSLPANAPVYDSCPELVKKMKEFLARDGVTKADFCRALGGINQNSLNPFLMGKNQDQCGNITYRRAYDFFEQKRILDGEPKSAGRLKNEAEHPGGFSLIKERAGKYMYFLGPSPSWAFS